ncbi:hypothetical protein BV898_13309 [Hypsibius exemplaris]|uniref:Receptor ligand binding region domain-containing protein n=1 Tax=Hypsibius exemplaris TaxID=2072580 RepID=A0A1W0WB98_HYPEX|nr:hypothetical protein BV898_13309 [Hypsibius exemplaris]
MTFSNGPCLFGVILCLPLYATTTRNHKGLVVNIVSPGMINSEAHGALNAISPALHTGLDVLRSSYPTIVWNSIQLPVGQASNCADLVENVQDLVARWSFKRWNSSEVNVVVTSGCGEVRPLTSLLNQFDLLLVTSVEAMDRIRDVEKYPTWIATNFYPNPSALYCTFLRSLNWTRVYVSIEAERVGNSYYYLSKFVQLQFKNCGIQSWQFTCHGPNDTCTTSEIANMLRDFHSKTRIMVVFCRPVVLWTILHVLQVAYQSVFLLHMVNDGMLTTPSIQKLVSKWERIVNHQIGHNNLTHDLRLPDLTSTHIAMELVGKVISEANASGRNAFSGRELARNALNRHFNLTVGEIFVTPQGQMRYETYVSYYDTELSDFKDFAKGTATSSLFLLEAISWIRLAKPRWFGRTAFPPDIPVCGLDGNSGPCARDVQFHLATGLGIAVSLTLLATLYSLMKRVILWMNSENVVWWILLAANLDMPGLPDRSRMLVQVVCPNSGVRGIMS